MYKIFNSSKFAGFASVAVLLVLIGVNMPVAYGKDVSLSDVPQVVRETIEREIKGYEIDDLEEDRDDGKIVYEIDADRGDDREIKIKVAADGTLLEKEKEIDSEDLPKSVVEAIKKKFGEVYFGDIEERFRKGRTFYKIEADTDKLEIELEIAEDGSILDLDTDRRDDDDDDLPRDFGDIRRMFLQLRGQLKIVSIGDSRVEMGIDPELMLDDENRKYPTALNLSAEYSHNSGVPLLKLLTEVYLSDAPKLEWVIWGSSSRMFSRYFNPSAGENIIESRTYRSDKRKLGWSELKTGLVAARDVDRDDLSPWGFEGADGTSNNLNDENDKKRVLRNLQKGRYELVPSRFNLLESAIRTLAQRNVKLLVFAPPIHPITSGQPCVDDDGTPRESYDELVARMNALDKKYPNFYFLDIHNKGDHDFEHREFKDMDHLNRKGAKKLTLKLDDFIKKNNTTKRIASSSKSQFENNKR